MKNPVASIPSASAAISTSAAAAAAPSSTFMGTRNNPGKGTARMAEPRAEKGREQHLYLLFDDCDNGYSIRKVSLSRRSGKRAGSGKQVVEPLPEVFMHIEARRGFPDLFTSAFGAKIMVMHPDLTDDDAEAIPMIDVQTHALAFGPLPRSCNACPIYFPVGYNRLFTLDIACFDCYLWEPEHSKEPWKWQKLPYPPFERTDVSSYTVDPNGCILVSATSYPGTFIFDTIEEYMWKQFSRSELPFTGRGHYDASLGGFVGLSRDGYVCFSTMAASATRTNTDRKRSKEKVYTERQHVSATLVHMCPGKFCLVECVSVDNRRTGQDLKESWPSEFKVPPGSMPWHCMGGGPQGGCCMYRIKTFYLTYDPKGDCLKLKNCNGQGHWYSLPHEARIGSVCMDPVAFWL